MGREYKIRCVPAKDAELAAIFRKLPSPVEHPQMREIYNYRVDEDGYYLVDHLIDRPIAARALQIFIDAALSTSPTVTIFEL